MENLQFSMIKKKGILKEMRDFLFKNKKFDKSLKGLGKGTWDFIKVEVGKKKLKIFSVDSESVLFEILNQILPDKKTDLKIDAHMFFLNESHKDEREIIESLSEKGFKVQIRPSHEDTSSITIKFESSIPKEDVMGNLNLFLKLHQMLQPYEEETEVNIASNSYLIFKMKEKAVELRSDIKEKEFLDALNLILFADNKSVPCSYQFYVVVKKITGDWKNGKREGYLVQKLKDNKKERIKKFKL